MVFTKLTVDQLKPKTKRYLVFELGGGGFAVRVAPTGTLTYVWVYRYNRKQKYYTIGKTSEITLKEARIKAQEAKRFLSQGIDPSSAKQIAKNKIIMEPTITELVEEYMEKWAKPRKRSWKEDERIFNYDILPTWSKRKASSITRREVVLMLEKIVERGSPIAANRTLAVIRRLYNFAIERDILAFSPCIGIKALAKENQRERVLTLEEIYLFWYGLDKASMSEEIKILLKLMLVTAQRKGELVLAKWVDFDLNQRWWIIPGSSAKNGQAHRVYLTETAVKLLEELKNLNPENPWLFPSPNKTSHVTPECISRAIARSSKIFSDTKKFTPHDLRRTAASHMTALGIPRLVVSKILNHIESHITAVYDRHSYDKEKQEALTKWNHLIMQTINQFPGENSCLKNLTENHVL